MLTVLFSVCSFRNFKVQEIQVSGAKLQKKVFNYTNKVKWVVKKTLQQAEGGFIIRKQCTE